MPDMSERELIRIASSATVAVVIWLGWRAAVALSRIRWSRFPTRIKLVCVALFVLAVIVFAIGDIVIRWGVDK